ncbi:hypothetical protein [Tissierella praeacuta]|uniref:hypothetical protein n=1 Tax=Tissierella praeacuta TaxID=43131 RepID=UPI00333E8876
MSKLFMYGTSLEGIEQLMLMVPIFEPRRSGIVINNYFNCGGGAKDCNHNVINVSKGLDKCGYIGSDFKVNVDKKRYKDLVMECFGKIKNNSLRNRLKELSKNFKGEVFLNHNHKERLHNVLQNNGSDTNDINPRYIAILFLLTADERLWKASKNSIRLNGFNFGGICLREINTEGYALYQIAKIISTGKEFIKINELADKDLIDDITFKTIINSALINRYGAEIFLITK